MMVTLVDKLYFTNDAKTFPMCLLTHMYIYIYFLFANLLILLIHRQKSYHSQQIHGNHQGVAGWLLTGSRN